MLKSEFNTDYWEMGEETPTTADTIQLIIKWLRDRNLVKGSTSKDQLCKLVQEVGEVSDAICKGDIANLESEIGDCIVILTNIATQNNLTIQGCVDNAYNKIKDRKGVMNDGIFIKEDDILTTYREPPLVAKLRKINNEAADALLVLASDDSYVVDIVQDTLACSFYWHGTPQGWGYWNKFHRALEEGGHYE